MVAFRGVPCLHARPCWSLSGQNLAMTDDLMGGGYSETRVNVIHNRYLVIASHYRSN